MNEFIFISQSRGSPGIEFQLWFDDQKNPNLNEKRLANVQEPLANQDASIKMLKTVQIT